MNLFSIQPPLSLAWEDEEVVMARGRILTPFAPLLLSEWFFLDIFQQQRQGVVLYLGDACVRALSGIIIVTLVDQNILHRNILFTNQHVCILGKTLWYLLQRFLLFTIYNYHWKNRMHPQDASVVSLLCPFGPCV